MLVERLDGGGVAGGLLAEVRGRGVARDELGEHEGYERDPEQEEQERGEPPQQEPQEAPRYVGAAPAGGRSRPDGNGGHRDSTDPAGATERMEGRTIGRC